jgi:hypothetical protein
VNWRQEIEADGVVASYQLPVLKGELETGNRKLETDSEALQ